MIGLDEWLWPRLVWVNSSSSHFFLWGPSALPIVGSTLTKGLSAPGGLVAKDHSRFSLRVRFWVDIDTDATTGGGGGEAGGVAMVL